MSATKRPLFDGPIVKRAIGDAFVKLNPKHMLRNPVMFVVLIGSVLTTLVLVRDVAEGRGDIGFTIQLAVWLWFTVVFANFAEAMAEGRGKAQADALRSSRRKPTPNVWMRQIPARPRIFSSTKWCQRLHSEREIWCCARPATSCPVMARWCKV